MAQATYFVVPVSLDLIQRKLTRFKVASSGCWEWTGDITHNGYGRTQLKSPVKWFTTLAHRAMFLAFYGVIPQDYVIDHLCKNRLCVNPKHLEAVSWAENNHRGDSFSGYNLRKTHCLRGNHPLIGNNLYTDPRGKRECRTCRNEAARRFLIKKGG